MVRASKCARVRRGMEGFIFDGVCRVRVQRLDFGVVLCRKWEVMITRGARVRRRWGKYEGEGMSMSLLTKLA